MPNASENVQLTEMNNRWGIVANDWFKIQYDYTLPGCNF